jgi:hypothetical protein
MDGRITLNNMEQPQLPPPRLRLQLLSLTVPKLSGYLSEAEYSKRINTSCVRN